MKMTFEAYEKKLETLATLPNVSLSNDYGITADDIEMMKKDGEKYISFLMYLSTRPWYRLENRIDKEFENEDALPCDEAAELIDELLYELVELTDEADETDETDEV